MRTLAVHCLRLVTGRHASPARIRQLEAALGYHHRAIAPRPPRPRLVYVACACNAHADRTGRLAVPGTCAPCLTIYDHTCPLRAVDLTVKEAS